MKLKTLHQFLQRLLVSFFICSALVFTAKAEDFSQGLLDLFESEVLKSKSQLSGIQANASSNNLVSNLTNISNIELTQKQLDTLIYLSSESDNFLFINNSCALYVYLKENVNFLNDNKVDKLEVEITLAGGEKKIETISIQNFSELYFKNKCQRQNELFEQMKVDKIKRVMEREKISYPTDEVACLNFYNEWVSNPQTPHMCSIVWKIKNSQKQKKFLQNNPNLEISQRATINEEIRVGSAYAQILSDTEYSLFSKFCSTSYSSQNFCGNYNKSNFWKTIENYTQDESKISWKCLSLYNTEKINRAEIINCMKRLEATPSICENRGNIANSSLIPMPNCDEISSALLVSKLNTNYHDCPANIGHNGITTTFRILKHFNKVKKEIDIKDCRFPSFASTYEIFLESKELNKWPLKVCYIEPIDKKEVCENYVPGNHETYTYAQNNVIGNILFNRKLIPNRQKCEVIENEIYKPERLKFRAGCYALSKKDECEADKCKLRIMIDGREIFQVYTKGDILFSFDKFKYNHISPSLLERIESLYQISQNDIQSLTSAVFHLTKVKNGIIAGVGCLEDILPEYFPSSFPNQCTPMPFIIDGYQDKDATTFLLTRLSIDDIHSPRLISWNNILNSVTRYAQFNPMKKWSFYGLR